MNPRLKFERPDPTMGDDPLSPATVLVPGFRDTPRILRPLAKRLRKRGVAPHMVSPQPSSGRVGIDELAAQLARYVDETFAPDRPLIFFGFSMGGLICRYYLQRLGGAARTRRLVTLATPHFGTYMAYFYPQRPACVQMRPGSDFLADLNHDFDSLAAIETISLWTPADLTIVPATNSCVPCMQTRRVLSPIHGLLLYDPWLLEQLVDLLTAPAPAALQTEWAMGGRE